MRSRDRLGLVAAALLAALLRVPPSMAAAPSTLPLTLDARPAELFTSAAPKAAQRLRLLGMLQLPTVTANGLRFSQISGLSWDADESVLYAISDKGALFHLAPRFRDGHLTGLTILKAVPLLDAAGKPLKGRSADSEGLEAVHARNGKRGDTELLISFERTPRIARYRPDGRLLGDLPLARPLSDANTYRGSNRMLESVCHDPAHGVLTAPEMPLRNEPAGQARIFSIAGQSWAFPLDDGQYISALECLGDGNVLVLARDFGRLLTRGVVTLTRARLPSVPADTPVRAEPIAVLDTSDGALIDNFEGLARHEGNRYFMVSDDNDLFIQRTLLLYFELRD